ncbi:MAG: hypothetical protein WEB52_06855 [Dehalococcoidia bacterium]
MKWIGTILAFVFALSWAFSPHMASAQEERDPLISPQVGERGSRFQIVGQFGWTPGEQVALSIGFVQAQPFAFDGPFAFEQEVTVLRDGTWSFPVVLNDALGLPLAGDPGYVVVRAQSPSKTATNAFVYTVDGRTPVGAEQIADLGFGPGFANVALPLGIALFALGIGSLLIVSGELRRRDATLLGAGRYTGPS